MGDNASTSKRPWEDSLQKYVKYKPTDRERVYLEKLTGRLQSNDQNAQMKALWLIRVILEMGPFPPFSQMIQNGVLPHLVNFLKPEKSLSLHFQVEAAYILGLFLQTVEHMDVVVEHGAIPPLLDLTHSVYVIIRILALDALGHIASRSPKFHDLRVKAWNPLLESLTMDMSDSITLMVTRALQNFIWWDLPFNPQMASQVLPGLLKLLQSSYATILAGACWQFLSLSKGRIDDVEPEIVSGLSGKLVEYVHHDSHMVMLPALKTVANLIGGDEIIEQNEDLRGMVIANLIKTETFKHRGTLLSGKYDDNIKMAACLVVRYIANAKCNHIEDAISNGIINALTKLYDDSEVEMRMEVTRAILNVVFFGTTQQIRSVAGACIQPLCRMLDLSYDQELALTSLRGLYRILVIGQSRVPGTPDDVHDYRNKMETCDALGKITTLRDNHKSVSDIAWWIIFIFWPETLL